VGDAVWKQQTVCERGVGQPTPVVCVWVAVQPWKVGKVQGGGGGGGVGWGWGGVQSVPVSPNGMRQSSQMPARCLQARGCAAVCAVPCSVMGRWGWGVWNLEGWVGGAVWPGNATVGTCKTVQRPTWKVGWGTMLRWSGREPGEGMYV